MIRTLLILFCAAAWSARAATYSLSLSQSNVVWASTNAVDGDTFTFAQGTANFSGVQYQGGSFYFGSVWTNAVTLDFSGGTITNTDSGDNAYHYLLYVALADPTKPFRITGLTINGQGHASGVLVESGQSVRVDHCNIVECNASGLEYKGHNVFGLIDHCNFTNSLNSVRVYGADNASWNDPIDTYWGLGTTNCVCVEDCNFVVNSWYGSHVFHYSGQGSRAIYRHNYYLSTVSGNAVDWVDMHGNNALLPAEARGSIFDVIENNTVTIPYVSQALVGVRGGCLIMRSNVMTCTEPGTTGVSLTDEEDWYFSAGQSNYGAQDWTTWPRQDQITNSWFVANTFNGSEIDGNYITNHFRSLVYNTNDWLIIQEGRDFFVTNSIPAPSFNNPGILGGWWGYTPLAYPHPLSIQTGEAQPVYVDYQGGSDSNAGSTSFPFKHCPGDPAATDTAAATTLLAGDAVRFKGGVSYTFTGATGISLVSGVAYDGAAWGSGRAILTDNRGGNSISAFFGTGNSNISILNFEFYAIGGSATLPVDTGTNVPPRPGNGIVLNGVASSVVISNCLFHELGYYFNEKPMDRDSIQGEGVQVRGCNGLVITNCSFSRLGNGVDVIFYPYVTNLDIGGCEFFDSITWCVNLAPTQAGAAMDRVNIHGCQFHDYWQYDASAWTGYGEWPHTDGIFHRSDYDGCQWGTNINFYGNLFSSTNGSGGTASIYVTEGPSANIYNNVFLRPGKGKPILLWDGPRTNASAQYINILNNTFVEEGNPCVSWGHYTDGTSTEVGTPGSVTILNNLLYDSLTGSGANFLVYSVSTNPVPDFTFNYNCYKSFNLNGNWFSYDWMGGATNLAGLHLVGWETNGLDVDPMFVNVTNDLRILVGSPVIGVGTNLSARFACDYAGNPRPTNGLWTLGAYEFQSTPNVSVGVFPWWKAPPMF